MSSFVNRLRNEYRPMDFVFVCFFFNITSTKINYPPNISILQCISFLQQLKEDILRQLGPWERVPLKVFTIP